MDIEPFPADWASIAVIVQEPGVAEAAYVTLTWPAASVVAKRRVKAPHDATAGLKTISGSPVTAAPLGSVTVAVIVELLAPSGGMTRGLAATATVFWRAGGGLLT
jgi:hypothetical protein